jgi:hypothetical protein
MGKLKGAGALAARPISTTAAPASKWGAISTSQEVGTILEAGEYPATITSVKVIDKDTALYMSVAVSAHDPKTGEVVDTDTLLTLGLVDMKAPGAAGRVREGLAMLGRLGAALPAVKIEGRSAEEIAPDLIGGKVKVKLAITGTGLERRNVIRSFKAVA